jgi:membrane protease YdiL (CAAX protease family)
MKRSNSPGAGMTRQETLSGLIYMVFQFVFLPSLLYAVNGMLKRPLAESELNFLYYFINFIAMLVLFHGFLGRSGAQAWHRPELLLEAVILGLAAYYACNWLCEKCVDLLMPGFANQNNASIEAMLRRNPFLMFIGTVILVPPFEECIFRGLIFRNLYGKNPAAAYIVSVALFALVHIVGFLPDYSPLEVVMAVVQYLPAGLCLAWSYTRGQTVFAPIFIHAAVNYITINGLR